MKIERIGETKTIMSNPDSKHNYFAWSTIARLKNGRIALAASGYRLKHVCPFGKTVISFSEDECETFSAPSPVVDTPLDDRDGGLLAFGESNVMVTSFNNTRDAQRSYKSTVTDYMLAYLDTVTDEEEEKYYGTNIAISTNNGATFGAPQRAPVSAPHGPIELKDGTVLYVGRLAEELRNTTPDGIYAYKFDLENGFELLGKIPDIDVLPGNPYLCEPHAIELNDGRILAHIRVNTYAAGFPQIYTTYQSISEDGGKTWEKPYQIIGDFDGAPAHLYRHSSGVIISSISKRVEPFEIKLLFSKDEGKTWDADNTLVETNVSLDFGYPSTVELKDGSLFTAFYAHETKDGPAVIRGQRWKFSE